METYTISSAESMPIDYGSIGAGAKVQSVRFYYARSSTRSRWTGLSEWTHRLMTLVRWLRTSGAQIITSIERNVTGVNVDEVTFSQTELGRRIIVTVKVGIEDGEI
ncbi:MAG: hypothetical protein HZT42_06075 [Paracoccaceae bacterium]|nr:MAG: hypothetical protein HZT42_06075 [Paracoccaceae bacterium]